MRLGGLDIIFSSLEHQTFKDFELVIVDNLYDYRKNIVAEKSKQFSFACKHIPPIENKFPIQAYCSALNSGIVNVSGDVILFTTDYRYFMPDVLQKHADFHKFSANNVGLAAPQKFVISPPPKHGLPHYGTNDKYHQYIQDLHDGVLDRYMWSIFETEFNKDTAFVIEEEDIQKTGWDPKTDINLTGLPGSEISPMYIYITNDSVKTETVLKANGMNEILDGARSHQDIEFSHRLRNLFDFRWIGDSSCMTYRVSGGHRIIEKLKLADNVDNFALSVFEKYKNGSKEPVNSYSLAEAHARNR